MVFTVSPPISSPSPGCPVPSTLKKVVADFGFFLIGEGFEGDLEPAEAGEVAFLDVFQVFVREFGDEGGQDVFLNPSNSRGLICRTVSKRVEFDTFKGI